jgi:hypothetical protein
MNEQSPKSVLESAASDPKIATAIAGSTAVVGAAARLDVIQGWLSVVSMGVGVVTALVVLGIQLIRLEKAWRERSSKSFTEKE